MAVAIALNLLQNSDNASEVGGVDGKVELAHPGLAAIGAGEGEGHRGLVGHIVAHGETEGVIHTHHIVGTDVTDGGGVLGNGDRWSAASQSGCHIAGIEVAHVAEGHVEGLALVEIHLTVRVVDAEAVEEHVGAIVIVEAKLQMLRPSVHNIDIKVKHIVVVDGGKNQFSLTVGIGEGRSDQLTVVEQPALATVHRQARLVGNGHREAVGADRQGGGAIDIGCERLVEPSAEGHIAQSVEGVEGPAQHADLTIHGDERRSLNLTFFQGITQSRDALMAIGIDELAVVMRRGTVTRLVVPAVTRVADGGHGTRLVHHHALQNAVVGKVAADTALALEDEIVVVGAVGAGKQTRCDVPVVPSRHVARVGVTEMVHILGTLVDGCGHLVGIPVMERRLINPNEIVIFGIAISGVTVEVDLADKTLKVLAGINAVA